MGGIALAEPACADRGMGRERRPAGDPPKRQGFGTRLVQRGLAQQRGGEIKLDFRPDGVRCVIVFPIKNVMVDGDGAGETIERYAS
ncbi:hypothetical protein AA309_16620 [Microvirga vignae]|uniref:Uncharacterized protein n=1 Tax=Microvirga vignae TaxID=1225564 RepID=A0A0H1RB07_9HYPH|nr:sensor histidine kinase [Microvirga vignae]KLK92046.1 hypothetical protein AA309_16620 [Microvirga vignae]